jgi:hypothetical protein
MPLILSTDDEASGPAAWNEIAARLRRSILPTLIIATRRAEAPIELGQHLPQCRLHLLEGESPWPRCATAVCAWIDGSYRSVAPASADP